MPQITIESWYKPFPNGWDQVIHLERSFHHRDRVQHDLHRVRVAGGPRIQHGSTKSQHPEGKNNGAYLVGGLEHLLFFHILGRIAPTDSYFSQSGYTTEPIFFSRECVGSVRKFNEMCGFGHVVAIHQQDTFGIRPLSLLQKSTSGSQHLHAKYRSGNRKGTRKPWNRLWEFDRSRMGVYIHIIYIYIYLYTLH